MKRVWSKRGQFYLLASIIIIAGIVGFAAVNNYAERNENIRVQDIGKELGFEGGEVLDHGIYNTFNQTDMGDLMQDFTMSYADYVGDENDIYFIYGNQEEVSVLSYEEVSAGSMSVNIGSNVGAPGLNIGQGKFKGKKFKLKEGEDEVEVKITEVKHKFKLKPGHNFYFVLSHRRGGERHVISNREDD